MLRSAANHLVADCVYLYMHNSTLKTRGEKFQCASRQAWRCFHFFKFSPVCNAWYVDIPWYPGDVPYVILTPKILIWRLCQNSTTPLYPRLSSPRILLVCSSLPLGPPSGGSYPLALRSSLAVLVESSAALLDPPPFISIPVWIMGSSETA